MEAFLVENLGLLVRLGPWIVFLITFLETSFFLGLLLPAEATILVATVLAERGHYPVTQVLAATFAGGFLGDQAGYWLGRYGGTRIAARAGFVGRLWWRHERKARSLFGRHAFFGITAARFISFVRTLMPWFAGMSGIPYGRYVAYDVLGVAGWAVGSVALGLAADQSWRLAAEALGVASTILIILLATAGFLLSRLRRRRAARATAAANTTHHPLYRVGLTGNIASGKSSVARCWRELGAAIVDADELARLAVAPGTPGLAAVRAEFGPGVIDPHGQLDRGVLRERVFNDSMARARLENILHPEVGRLREREDERLRASGARIVVHEIPLLFEVGLQDEFDVLVLVDAPEDVRRARLVEHRGLDSETATRMIEAQMPTDVKREAADFVIDNTGTEEHLRTQAVEVWKRIQEGVS